jgi:hypothetical protein
MDPVLSKHFLQDRPLNFLQFLSPDATRLGGPLFLRHVLNGCDFSGLTLHEEEKKQEQD